MVGLLYKRANLIVATAVVAGIGIAAKLFGGAPAFSISMFVFAGVLAVLAIAPLRASIITRPIFGIYKKILPQMSDTEKTALDAGTVGWDGELFAGKPNWQRLFDLPKPELSAEEQAFLDGPCSELTSMINSWEIDHEKADLPKEMWQFIKDNKFFGMIIPKKFGGLEFSAQAQSAVLQMVSANSSVMSTIGVPNSLGPGELLLKYGTDEQKNHYLPRLADGREVPCFALTGPRAGSDATSLPDTGVVCKGEIDGKEVVGIKLNFSKRYITLAPVATVVGLAFRMFDPDGLIGDQEDIGITCALVPRNTPNMTIGRRHHPTGSPFLNGPIQGEDVFIPLDWIIGGKDMAGQGWKMLVECLSVGRCITLPSSGTGGAKYAAAATGAYARIRRQFNVSVSQLEGVQEALARIAGNSYIASAATTNTAAMVDMGEKPSVPSAILKYHLTEIGRSVAIDGMDVHGGRGVMMGPRNYIGRGYQSVPVAITVEGANILTRSMIIFGQGAIRCHPYVLPEMDAAQNDNLGEFDKALFGHFGFIFSNLSRSLVLGATGAKFTSSPVNGPTSKYYKQINRHIATFSLLVDAAMFSLGGALKFREMISARLGDLASSIYLTTMVLKHWENQGRIKEDLPLVEWACQKLANDYEEALDGLLKNLPNRPLAFVLRRITLPWGKTAKAPSDKLITEVSSLITNDTESRNRLVQGIYQGDSKVEGMENPIQVYNQLLAEADRAQPLYKKVSTAVKKDILNADLLHIEDRIKACAEKGVLTQEEADFMIDFEARVLDMLHVDDFEFDAIGTKPQSYDEYHAEVNAA
ncbi:acyl-coenzyme A dehydrogenase [gamma proteobacterium HTCC5015]|nr:acyl-coenzyme A dehydrogenase [gamma proteobacterium HTCC5015]